MTLIVENQFNLLFFLKKKKGLISLVTKEDPLGSIHIGGLHLRLRLFPLMFHVTQCE